MHMVTLGEHAEPLVRRLATDLGLPAQAGQPHTKGLQHVTENGVRYVVIVHTANLLQERALGCGGASRSWFQKRSSWKAFAGRVCTAS